MEEAQIAACIFQHDARLSLDRVASHEFTEEMVRSAAAFSCIYDGWEAQVK